MGASSATAEPIVAKTGVSGVVPAMVMPLIESVIGAPKQLQGSKMKNGVNINALTSQKEADMGRGPVYYSTLAEIQKISAA